MYCMKYWKALDKTLLALTGIMVWRITEHGVTPVLISCFRGALQIEFVDESKRQSDTL